MVSILIPSKYSILIITYIQYNSYLFIYFTHNWYDLLFIIMIIGISYIEIEFIIES